MTFPEAQSAPAQERALFVLPSVVFADGILTLRVFETRYLDMVRSSLREGEPFVICMPGSGQAKQPRQVGTLVDIIDFDQLDDGLLGITVQGRHRAALTDAQQSDGGLWIARARPLATEPECPLPERFDHLADMATRILQELGAPYSEQPVIGHNAVWVGHRLTELLPVHPDVKQDLLESADTLGRLARLDFLIQNMVRAG